MSKPSVMVRRSLLASVVALIFGAPLIALAATTFTTNSIATTGTLQADGNATFDTNTMFVDAANNNVGIGTVTPAAGTPLTLSGPNFSQALLKTKGTADRSSALLIENNNVSSRQWHLGVGGTGNGAGLTSGELYVWDNNALATRFVIDTSGKVGIGDSSPASLLTVGSGDRFQIDANGDMVKIDNVTYDWPSANASGVLTNNGTGTLSWAASASAGGWTDDGTNVRLTTVTDRVGIGIATPGSPLEVRSPNVSQADMIAAFWGNTARRIAFYDEGGGSGPKIAFEAGLGGYITATSDLFLQPTGSLYVSGTAFSVSSTGDLARIKSVAYAWPSANASGVLTNNGSGTLTWAAASTTAAGSSGQIQFNSSNALGADGGLNWDNTNKRLGIGTAGPSDSLEVNGGALAVVKTAAATMKIKAGAITPTNGSANLEFYNIGTSRQWSLISDLNANGTNGLTFTKANSNAVLHLSQSGLVKIGGTDPSTSFDVGGDFAFRRMASTDLSSTGTQNNVNFEATSRTSLAAFTGSADVTITGIANGFDGKILNLINRSASNNMILANLDAGSSAANQIVTGTGASVTVAAGAMIALQYDYNFNGSGAKWRVVSPSSSMTSTGSTPAGATGQIQFNNAGAFGANSKLFWDNTNFGLIASKTGLATAPLMGSHTPKFSATATSGTVPVIASVSYATNASLRNDYAAMLMLARSNNNTEGTLTYPANGQTLGQMDFAGAVESLSAFYPSASVTGYTGGAWTASSWPSKLGFFTMDVGSTSEVERMTVDPAGKIGIGDTSPASLLTVGSGDRLQVNASGDVFSTFTSLDGSTTANGAGASSTTLILTSGTNFDVGNYVLVNSTYAKITAKSSNTLTISPALTWSDTNPVTEWHVPEVGGVDLTQALTNRYGRGYFIDGIVTGNGSTNYSDGLIKSTGAIAISTSGGLSVDGIKTPQYVEVTFNALLGAAVINQDFFIASQPYEVVSVNYIHSAAASLAANVQLTKDTGTVAPGTGAVLLTNNTNAGFNLNAVANTFQSGALTGTAANLQMAAGDRLGVSFSGTVAGALGLVVTVTLKRL